MSTYFTKEIRLKKQRVSIELINHCRALLIGWTEKLDTLGKPPTITIPFSLEFEKKVIGLALEFVKTLLSDFMTSIEEDEELEEKAQKHEQRQAIKLRLLYKQILNQQIEYLELCLHCVQNWKQGRIDVKD